MNSIRDSRSFFQLSTVCLLTVFLLACGGGGGGTPDTTAPVVLVSQPPASATDVDVGVSIQVTFSEPVRLDTVNSSTFQVSTGGTQISGTYAVSGDTASFAPLVGLTTNSTYTVLLTTSIRDLAGNPLSAPHSWDFSTITLAAVDLAWLPSRAAAVNQTGGGYKVYYGNTPGFTIVPGVKEINVPWPGSGKTPSTAEIQLPAGSYYFKVIAYSALDSGGVRSAPSTEISLTIR